ncbi:MAG: FlgD immunoglobulin-like domain containing protein, partial [bacterium]
GDPVPTYSLLAYPAGMTIDTNTGLIEWTPAAAGSVQVTVEASNIAGSDTQSYMIHVSEPPLVVNVELTSTFGLFSTTDDLFCTYDLAGSAVTSATTWYADGAPLMGLYLPFEGGAVNALNDYSGNSIVMTPHGDPAWNPAGGHDGFGAMEFDGNDDLGGGDHFPLSASYTKTAWVYRTGSGANGGNNVMSGDENTGGHAFWAPDMFGNHLSAGHNAAWDLVQDSEPLALNTWYFVAVSFDYDSGLMVLYKDSTAVDSAVVTGENKDVTDATISVGSFGASNGWMWKGTLDDVRLYNRALSDEQIRALYFEGSDVIKPAETEIGDQWFVCVTPFSAAEVGIGVCSDSATIMDETVPVALQSFESRWSDNHIEISWVLIGVDGDVTFEVLRREGPIGGFDRIYDADVTGREGRFLYVDPSARPGTEYTYRISVVQDGNVVTSFETSPVAAPLEFALRQNHPNPFNPTTSIEFSLDRGGHVSLQIFDISGRLVRTVADESMGAGNHTKEWNGRNNSGEPVASGIYFYRLTAGKRPLT